MATEKTVSHSVVKALENKDKDVKTATVRIIDADPVLGDIKPTIMVNGHFAKVGDLVEILEHEATDLVLRGRAERLA